MEVKWDSETFSILPQNYTESQPRRPCSGWRWTFHGPLNLEYITTPLNGITTQKTIFRLKVDVPWTSESRVHYHTTTRRHDPKDHLQGEGGGGMNLWNVGILPQHYTASQPRRPSSGWRWTFHGPLKRWYPITKLHGVTTQKILTLNITAVKVSKLTYWYCW
jgi:hypothetical protein